MKVIILAGGYGTRISEYTETIPKPMIPIKGVPILMHIMRNFATYGHSNFYLALGYKSESIKEYFLNYSTLNSDFTINLKSGNIKFHKTNYLDWSVTLANTGIQTMTGGRLKRLKEHIGNERFLLTYGDGLSNIDINELISFHEKHNKLITITAVRPSARFGQIEIKDSQVTHFKEKPQIDQGWINGGFMVIEPDFIEMIENDETVLEKEPLERAAQEGQMMAFKHNGFWQCMDTKRDRQYLESLLENGSCPWIKE